MAGFFIAFLPQSPEAAADSPLRGFGKKAILSFAEVSGKFFFEMRCGGMDFELVDFGAACCCKG